MEYHLGFRSCLADPDIWMHEEGRRETDHFNMFYFT